MNRTVESASALSLNVKQTQRVRSALEGLTTAELQWASGYVAGLLTQGETAQPVIAQATAYPSNTMTILYGSQTGNGRAIAEELRESAVSRGFAANLLSLADYKPANIKRETLISLIVSTHGEGDPPDDAELFHEYLLSNKVPQLQKLKYSVFALGDSSYVNFCQIGKELDSRLNELGAERLVPTVECDLDYDAAVENWADNVLKSLPDVLDNVPNVSRIPRLHAVKSPVIYNKKRPFKAEVLTNQKITGTKSTKDVRHIELSLEGSGLIYEPGDSLAVITNNPPQLIEELLNTLDFSGNEEVKVQGSTFTIRDALRTKFEITALNLGFLKAYAELANSQDLRDLLQPDYRTELSDFLETRQIIDVVSEYPALVSATEFAASLRKLMPRSYSIASSLLANPDEVHLTVASVNYQAFGREHWGAASTMLVDQIVEGDKISVFVESNPRFRLPVDGQTSLIMIGPGTGIAPFRAFLEQRTELGATGKNWLFLGDRSFHNDFLYQLEWQRFLKHGTLHRLDAAFSRDQVDKIYVQHRIEEHGARVYEWLQQGATIYVCGDAKYMANDVHDALVNVLVVHGRHDKASAEGYLKDLRRTDRYQRDVY